MICGSDVNVVFYYLGWLIEVGDLISINCCFLVIVYEDIGLVDLDVGMRIFVVI